MLFRWWADGGPTLNAGLVWFFRGSGPVLLRNPIFFRFFRRVRTACPPSGSAHVIHVYSLFSVCYHDKYYCREEGQFCDYTGQCACEEGYIQELHTKKCIHGKMSLLSYRFDSIDTYFELKADSFRICINTRKPVFVGAIRLLSLRYEEAN